MKTLSQTISGMTELYLSGKVADIKDVVNSAIHYLKESQTILNNDPLTIKEITKLPEGEALWIEGEASPGTGWYIYKGRHMTLSEYVQGTHNTFRDVPCDHIDVMDDIGTTYVLHREDQGKRWNAYRYKRGDK